ncbi:MAG: hypothetical protein LDL41_14605 [Coleofasciculus sp. S288]|nr:hypothetical protein [Coleofasciculus sp. S288]
MLPWSFPQQLNRTAFARVLQAAIAKQTTLLPEDSLLQPPSWFQKAVS